MGNTRPQGVFCIICAGVIPVLGNFFGKLSFGVELRTDLCYT